MRTTTARWVATHPTVFRRIRRVRGNAPRFMLLAVLLLAGPTAAQVVLSDMVTVPPGPFTMGSSEGPDDERPAHEVTLAAFSIDRFPVTNAQYAEFLNNAASARVAPRPYDFDDPDARIHRRGGSFIADSG